MDKRERFLELMDQSSERALCALGCFLGCDLGPPERAREWDLPALESLRPSATSQIIALFVDLDGAIGGHLLLLADRDLACELVAPLVKAHMEPERELWACSALLEAGNVVFSAAAGALGDAVGVVVFPSIPSLYREADPAFRAAVGAPSGDGLGVYAVDVVARRDEGRPIRMSLLWVPTHSD